MDIRTATTVSRISLFTALIAAGSYISIPIPGSPAPVVLANLFAVLAGIVLGPKAGAASTTLYLMLGLAGLPIFAAGAGGVAHLAGPTGGFLVGYLLAAIVAGSLFGLLSKRTSFRCTVAGGLAAAAGLLAVYIPGVVWMSVVLELSPAAAFAAGVIPFLPGDIAKVGAAALVLPAIERSPIVVGGRSPVANDQAHSLRQDA
ncbi:MAG: biotin transporter BioY [Spirochaetales bacterium]